MNISDTPYDPDYKNAEAIITSFVSFIYAAPAFFIVFRMCVLFLRGRLKGSFQKLICVFGINDLLCYSAQMVGLRVPNWGTVPGYGNFVDGGVIPTLIAWTLCNVVDFQVCGCVILSLNRATSVLFPVSYNRFWKSYGWLLVILAALSLQFLTYRTAMVGAKFSLIGPDAYVLLSNVREVEDDWFSNSGILYVVGFLLCFVLNIYTGITLYSQRKKKRNPRNRSTEIRFFYVCLVTLACQVLLLFAQSVINQRTEENPSQQKTVHIIRSILFDINCLLPLYSLLLLSKEVRCMVYNIQ